MSLIQLNPIQQNPFFILAQASPTSSPEAVNISQIQFYIGKTAEILNNNAWKLNLIKIALQEEKNLSKTDVNQLKNEKVQLENQVLEEIKNIDSQISRLKSDTTSNPYQNKTLQFNLLALKAVLYLIIDKKDEAQRLLGELENTIKNDNSFGPTTCYVLALYLINTGYLQEAENFLKKGLELKTNATASLYGLMARLAIMLGKSSTIVLSYLEKMTTVSPDPNLKRTYSRVCLSMSEVVDDPDLKEIFKTKALNMIQQTLSQPRVSDSVKNELKLFEIVYSLDFEKSKQWLRNLLDSKNLDNFTSMELWAAAKIMEKNKENPEKIFEVYQRLLKKPGNADFFIVILDCYLPFKWVVHKDSNTIQKEQKAIKFIYPNCKAVEKYQKLLGVKN